MSDTLLPIVLSASAKGTLLVALAALVARSARNRSAAFRHGIWASTLGGLLILAPLAVALPGRALPWLPTTPTSELGAPFSAADGSAVHRASPPLATRASVDTDAARSPRPLSPWLGSLGVRLYGAGTAAVLGYLLVGLLGIWRIDRKSHPWRGRLPVRPDVRVVVSPLLAAPLTWGWRHPTILLPTAALRWPTDRLHAVLAHETAHVDRSDWMQLVVARTTAAIFWFHPMVWWAVGRHQEEAERACDDRVLASGFAPEEYAQQLVAIAREVKATHPMRPIHLANAMAQPSYLSRRVRAILESENRRSPMNRYLAVGIAVSAFILVLAIAPTHLTHAATPNRAGSGPASSGGETTDVGASGSGADGIAPSLAIGNPASPTLLQVVRSASLGRIEGLLAADADPNFAREGDGTVLIRACRAERPRVVDLLLAAGADPNLSISGDGSPLIAASAHGRADLVEALLAAGADPNLGVENDGSPLIAAAARGHAHIVTRLLAAGAAVDQIVRHDETALIQAAWRGELEAARLLLDAGADPNLAVTIQNLEGELVTRSPWRQAQRGGHREVVDLLERHGAIE